MIVKVECGNVSGKLKSKSSNKSVLIGAAFIMATSAVGPGFLTQTAEFTDKYASNLAFVILISIIFNIGVQLNVWRVIGVSGMRGQDIANKLVPGLGYFVATIVALGGLAFNIGNIGGAALGLNVITGLNVRYGAIICGIIGSMIFLCKETGVLMDNLTRILVIIMIIIVSYVAVKTHPPIGEVIIRSVEPKNPKSLMIPIITLLGGTVGGYITFSGGHRLIDSGITGINNIKEITNSAILGVIIASIMRVLVFLAVLGVVNKGIGLDPSNPAASAFKSGAGIIGYKLFGIVLISAGLNTVIGAAYTSVSFLKTLHPFIKKYEKYFIIGFIVFSTIVVAFIGKPANLLILAGALNGLILPITIGVMLVASRKKDIVGEYIHPNWMLILGILIVIASSYAGIMSITNIF